MINSYQVNVLLIIKIVLILSQIILFSFLYVLFPIGDDIQQYLNYVDISSRFENINDLLKFSEYKDVFFYVISYIIYAYSSFFDSQLFTFSLFFSLSFIFLGYFLNFSIFQISVFLFLILFSRLYLDFTMNAIRTEYAAILILINIALWLKEKYKSSFIFLILALNTHMYLFLLYILLLLSTFIFKNILTRRISLLILIIGVVNLFGPHLLSSFINQFSSIFEYFYPNSIYYFTTKEISISLKFQLLSYLIIPMILVIFYNKNSFFIKFLSVSTFFIIYFYSVFPLSIRIFSVIYPLMIFVLLLEYKKKLYFYMIYFLFNLNIFVILNFFIKYS